MTGQPRVAIVILNYNTCHLLEKYLPSVLNTSYKNKEVWVVDNASIDDSVSFLEEQYADQVQLLVSPKNLGYAGGYNWALKQIEASYYVLINSDVRVTENWLIPLIELANENPNIGAIQPKILDDKQASHFEYAGACGGYLDRFGYPFCRGRIFESLEKDKGQYNTSIPVFWATGACLFLRAEAFHQVDGFDSDFFAHMEEIDLCWRLQHQNFKVYVQPKSEVYHLGGGTLAEGSAFKYFLNFRNNLIMLTKNTSSSGWVLYLIGRMLLDGISGLKFLLNGKPQLVWSILKAHADFWSTLTSTLKKRAHVQSTSLHIPSIYPKSIVWAYFLRGKKTFIDLKDVE